MDYILAASNLRASIFGLPGNTNIDQIKKGRLAFDDNNYVFDGKVYDIDKLDLESKKLPWEKEAYE